MTGVILHPARWYTRQGTSGRRCISRLYMGSHLTEAEAMTGIQGVARYS